MTAEPILVWGAGAIGGTLGAYWARAGLPVLLVDCVREHVEACRMAGLSIEGPVEAFTQAVPAAVPEEVRGRFRRIVLAVKAQATKEALAELSPHLAEDGFVLSAQNGLNELAIAQVLGPERTMGCFVNFGADWLGPGRILYGNRSAVVVGEIDGSIRARTRAMHDVLRLFEPEAALTDDIWAYLWGKLSYGAMLFATALTDDSIAENFADPRRLPVWLALGREVAAVAEARGVRLNGFGEFDPDLFRPGRPEAPQRDAIAWLARYTAVGAKTHSGIWRDLAVRRRRTEVDAQIGVIARLAAETGLETPAIDALVALVHDVEDGRRPRAFSTFQALIDRCTSASMAASPS